MVYQRPACYFCSRCGSPFELTKGRYSMYYRCKNYRYENRKPEEKVCTNKISLGAIAELEKAIENQWKSAEESAQKDIEIFWKKKNIHAKILEIDDDIAYILVGDGKEVPRDYNDI